MFLKTIAPRTLPALASACMLSAAMPAFASGATTAPVDPAPVAFDVEHAVTIPSVEAINSTISDDVLTAILSGDIADHADELAGLNATSITVPEILVSVSSTSGDDSYQTSITLTDLVLTDIVDGIAGAVTLGGIDMTTDKTSASFGTMSAANFNIGQLLAVYGLVDTGRTGIETIYTDFSSIGGSLTGEDIDCDIGAAGGAEFKARPLKTSFLDMMAIAQAMEGEPDDIDPAMIGQIARMYADIFTAFETSEITFEGISCEGFDDDGAAISVGLDGMVMGPMSPGIYPSFSMDGFSIVMEEDGALSLDNLTIKPTDLNNIVALLENLPDDVDEAWFDANARLLVPAMEGLSFAGFAMDVPDPDGGDYRIKASISAFDLSLANYINGIPSDLDISLDNVRATLPDSDDEAIEQLRALGITELDASLRFAAAWDEATSTIDIREISASGVDLASVTLAGTIANAGADLFSLDENEALMAGMGVALKALDMRLVDAGLADLILSVAAAEQGGSPEQLRLIYADLAKGTIIGVLAGVADAAKLGDAVSTFVSGAAKTLEIGITAKDDPGIGMMDVMAAEEDPSSLLGKVNITAVSK